MTDNAKSELVEKIIRLPAWQHKAICQLLTEENGEVSDEAYSELLSQAVSLYFLERLREDGQAFVEKHGLTDENLETLIEETIAEVRTGKKPTGA